MEQILELAVYGDMDMNDVEDMILYQLLQCRKNRFLRSNKYEKLNLSTLCDEECRNYFRFTKEDLYKLVKVLKIPDEIITENGYRVSAVDGLCMYLRRLAYPNRLSDLEPLFGLSAEYISVICNEVLKIISMNTEKLLNNLSNLKWLDQNRMQYYADAVALKGAPLRNCWGFIDGTARGICRPSINQEEYFSGHKRFHCVKYQSVLCPDGMIVSLIGPYPGRRHDSGILRESNLYHQLQKCASFATKKYVLYGDPAYPVREHILCPYPSRQLTPQQQLFNSGMSKVRQAVEWGFGKIISDFAFLDFKKNQKLLLQNVGLMYKTATVLTNCHTCLYGSQTSEYFRIAPPTLEDYLSL